MSSAAITVLPDKTPLIVAYVALAPSAKPDDPITNASIKFQIAVEPDEYGSVANALRILCEDSHSNYYLPFICNRVLEESTLSNTAVELVYGNGFKTFMSRKGGPDLKAYKKLAMSISLGSSNETNIDDLPILMPDDNFYFHVAAYATLYGSPPTLYIRTGGPMFLHPREERNESSIQLTVPNKRGFWTGAVFDGDRERYPSELPIKPPATRKRKGDSGDSGSKGEKKAKLVKKESDGDEDDDDDDDSSEDKPAAEPAEKEDVDSDDEEEPSKELVKVNVDDEEETPEKPKKDLVKQVESTKKKEEIAKKKEEAVIKKKEEAVIKKKDEGAKKKAESATKKATPKSVTKKENGSKITKKKEDGPDEKDDGKKTKKKARKGTDGAKTSKGEK